MNEFIQFFFPFGMPHATCLNSESLAVIQSVAYGIIIISYIAVIRRLRRVMKFYNFSDAVRKSAGFLEKNFAACALERVGHLGALFFALNGIDTIAIVITALIAGIHAPRFLVLLSNLEKSASEK